jgi:hypothetical protein
MGRRILLFLTGLALLPLCAVITRTVVSMLMAAQPSSDLMIPPAAIAFAVGFFLWLAIFALLPTPVRAYILAHELTHALWALLMGEKVHSIRIKKDSGSVSVSNTNILITLAPYFFPLYTILVVITYLFLGLLTDMQPYHLIWVGLVGLTWSFHITFTLNTLLVKQSDIRDCGHLFSYAFIYLMNMAIVALWLLAISSVTGGQLLDFLLRDLRWIAVWFRETGNSLIQLVSGQ